MKKLAEDFANIFGKDRGFIGWMPVNLALSVWMFLLSILNLNSGIARTYFRYSDMSGYKDDFWWYLFSFALVAIVLGPGHLLISARIHSRKGRDVARLFLGVSCAILFMGIHVLMSVLGEG